LKCQKPLSVKRLNNKNVKKLIKNNGDVLCGPCASQPKVEANQFGVSVKTEASNVICSLNKTIPSYHEMPFFSDGIPIGWWSLVRFDRSDKKGDVMIQFDKHFLNEGKTFNLGVVEYTAEGQVKEAREFLDLSNVLFDQHPTQDYALIRDKSIVAKALTIPKLKVTKAHYTEVPIGTQVFTSVLRNGITFLSGNVLKKSNGEYVVQNTTAEGDCGRLYVCNGQFIGIHRGTYGTNLYNVLIAFAQVQPWVLTLN
jgi:hypothetical protein